MNDNGSPIQAFVNVQAGGQEGDLGGRLPADNGFCWILGTGRGEQQTKETQWLVWRCFVRGKVYSF